MISRDSYDIVVQSKKLTMLFWILFLAVIAGMAYVFRSFFWPFLFAVIFYIGLRPLYIWLKTYLRSVIISSMGVLGVVITVILIPLFLLLLNLTDQVMQFYNFLQSQLDPGIFKDYIARSEIVKTVLQYINITYDELFQRIVQYMQDISLAMFANLTNILTFSIKFSIDFFFMLLMLFFLLVEGDRFAKSIYTVLPFPLDIQRDIGDKIKNAVRVLLVGNFVIMLIQGVMVGIGFIIVGLSAPILWGIIAAFFSLIPVVGSSLVWIPAFLYLLAIGSPVKAVFIVAWCLGSAILLDYVVKPIAFGEKLKFHPLILFFLLLGSLHTFQLPGLIIGPIMLTLLFSLWEMYKALNSYTAVHEEKITKRQKKK